MKEIECETCIKRKTMYCPNSSECFNTENKPYYQNRIMLLEEIQELKKQLEEYKNDYFKLSKENNEYAIKLHNNKNQQKEFISYLENEKDRLARECSQIYEDSLGKTRLVNEDIFNEVDTILSKYKEIIGGKDER